MHKLDTLFLDRDGVINIKMEGRYLQDFAEFKFLPDAIDAISKLTNKFNRMIIVTNQQGIEKGIMSNADLKTLHARMKEKIEQSGGRINKIYYCPHLEESDCPCRKPKPGMIEYALLDFPEIVIEDSYLIGDSDSDIEAGKRMNLSAIKVNNEYTLAKWTTELLFSV